MADKNDWVFWILVLAGGFLIGYLLEQHLHIIENIFLGKQPVEQKEWPPIAVASAPSTVEQSIPRKKYYPNPIYDPYVDNDWDALDDAWYYTY